MAQDGFNNQLVIKEWACCQLSADPLQYLNQCQFSNNPTGAEVKTNTADDLGAFKKSVWALKSKSS